jgi:hypothetical protein
MPLANPSDVENRITELDAGWYNQICKAISVDPATFLLAQGTLGLSGTDSSGLFRMSDAVPPSASVAYFDAGGMQMRSQAYKMLLNALLPEGGSELPQVLKDLYASWIVYRTEWAKNPASKETQLQAFEAWAERNLDPKTKARALTVFMQAANTPLNGALEALNAANARQQFVTSANVPYLLYVYSATIDEALRAVAGGKSVDIAFDSSHMNTTLVHATAEGSASGFYDIFSGGAAGSFEQLNSYAAFSQFEIDGKIGSVATLPVEPGSWFNSAEVKRGYDARNDYTVWDRLANAGNWESFFAPPGGSLARRVSQLILFSDYEIVVKSNANYTAEQYSKIVAEAKFGIWPFFSGSAKATHETDYQQGADGSLIITYKLPKGLVQVWGVTVQSGVS